MGEAILTRRGSMGTTGSVIARHEIVSKTHDGSNCNLTSPIDLEYYMEIQQDTNFNNISLDEVGGSTKVTTKSIIDNEILRLAFSDSLKANKFYNVNLPLTCLKDKIGNTLKGVYTYQFKTKSVIASTDIKSNLMAYHTNGKIILEWIHPQTDPIDFVGIKVLKRLDTYPTGPNDSNSIVIYDGINTSFVDESITGTQPSYYYRCFPYDSAGIFNEGITTNQLNILTAPSLYYFTTNVSLSTIKYIIDTAIDGSIMYFEEGIYLIDSPIIIDRSNISLIGIPNKTIFKTNGNYINDGIINIIGTSENKLMEIKIENIIFDGTINTNINSSGINIKYVGEDSYNSSQYYVINTIGSSFTNKSSVNIQNCIFKNHSGNGINIENSSHIRISGCNITDNLKNGVLLTNSNGNVIRSNILKYNTINGINIKSGKYNIAIQNNITNNYSGGISISDSIGNNINGNNIRANSIFGIGLDGCTRHNLSGNNISNNNLSGIYLSNSSYNSIMGNISISHVYGYNIINNSNNNTFTGNTGYSNSLYGLYLDSINNSVSGNNFNSNTTSNLYININGRFNTITGNTYMASISNNGSSNYVYSNY